MVLNKLLLLLLLLLLLILLLLLNYVNKNNRLLLLKFPNEASLCSFLDINNARGRARPGLLSWPLP